MRLVFLTVSIALLAAVPCAAITPYLVRDISRISMPENSNPDSFVSLGNRALFWAGRGGDLWASDGTSSGTLLIQPRLAGRPFALAGDTAYVLSTVNGSPFSLWSSRGTSETTEFLSDFALLGSSGIPVVSVPGTRTIFFLAADPAHGRELWTSDGTAAGTHLVIDLKPGIMSGEVTELTWFRGRLFFNGDDGRGFALWSTDGTAAGMRRVRVFTQSTPEGAFLLRALPNRLIYFGPERGRGYEMWASDGTTAGTVPLPEIASGSRSAFPRDAIVVGNRYYAVASDGRTGSELWTTDGTAGGTRQLTRFRPAEPFEPSGRVFSFYQLPNRLVFHADDGSKGQEPWVSDGTVAGTKMLADLCVGSCGSASGTFPSPPNRLLIGATQPATGSELWTTDGTPAGTRLLKDICPGTCSSNEYGFHRLGNRILFAATDGAHGEQLWSTDGTPGGTARISNLADPMPFGGYFPGTAAGGSLVFPAQDAVHGRELWSSRGRLGTTRLVADLEPGQNEFSGSFPSDLVSAGTRTFFFANDGIEGYELWASDGTAAGTVRVSDFAPGSDPGSPPFDLKAAGGDGRLLFAASIATGQGLWIADGSPDGTLPIGLPGGQRVEQVAVVGDRPYFSTFDSQTFERRLWKTDWTGLPRTEIASSPSVSWLHAFGAGLLFSREGSAEEQGLWIDDSSGLRRLAAVTPQSEPTTFGGKVWFFGRDADGQEAVWATDGTEAGTVETIFLQRAFGGPKSPLAGGTTTLYVFGDGEQGIGLYAAEGTEASLRYLGVLWPSLDIRGEKTPVVLGDRLFFEAPLPGQPGETVLWSSDGTPSGTAPLQSDTNASLFNPIHLQVFAGKVVGFLFDSWFVSDGTPAGTTLHKDPNVTLSAFSSPAQAAGRLFFPATSPEAGTEIWALQP